MGFLMEVTMNKNQRYYYKNLEAQRERGREKYRKTIGTPEGAAMTLLRGAKQRAEKKGVPFDLDYEWVYERVSAGHCSVTGLPFNFSGGKHPFGPTLDRIVPEGGYTKENTQVVVWAYNAAKGVGTHEDVMALACALTYPLVHSNDNNP